MLGIKSNTETPSVEKKEDRAVEAKNKMVNQYLLDNFPKKEGEDKVDYNRVWDDHFRINYWKISGNGCKESGITRSLFVILSFDGKNISHKVFDN